MTTLVRQLGSYRLEGFLGQGGFANVYLGRHMHLDSLAAIKLLHGNLTRDKLDRFYSEARTLAQLDHPNITRVLDFDVDGSTPFLVTEYAPHGSLYTRYYGMRLRLPSVISYIKQAAQALDYIHAAGVIHCDIKPKNMLLSASNRLLLSDFGISLMMSDVCEQPARLFGGSPAYMAPDYARGYPSAASDIYALGVVAYELLSGYLPFYGSRAELAEQHRFTPPVSLCKMVPDMAPAVDRVVLKALHKDPNQRYSSARAFAVALEQASQPGALDRPSRHPAMRYQPVNRAPQVAVARRQAVRTRQQAVARQR